jgi:hypothetical protein
MRSPAVVAMETEEPRPDHRFAWPRLSDTNNERAGGTTAALLLAGFGCPAGLGRIELAGGVLAGALYASRAERVRAHRGDGRELDRQHADGGPGAIDLCLERVCRTTG